MGATTGISWCDSTFNPWRGCARVSPGCEHCYAERFAKWTPSIMGQWGPSGTRVFAAPSKWREVLDWNAEAERTGEPRRVFEASSADIFEDWRHHMVDAQGDVLWLREGRIVRAGQTTAGLVLGERPATMDDARLAFFELVMKTEHLTHLVLTKRIDQVMPALHRLPDLCSSRQVNDGLKTWLVNWRNGYPPKNLRLGCTAENQEWADKRLPELLKIPNVCPWVSYEPALGPVDWSPWLGPRHEDELGFVNPVPSDHGMPFHDPWVRGLDWIIVGGESGAQARPFDVAWARNTVAQCKAAGVAAFVKQLGAKPFVVDPDPRRGMFNCGGDYRMGRRWLKLRDKAGADPSEWPEDLRVQEFPRVAA